MGVTEDEIVLGVDLNEESELVPHPYGLITLEVTCLVKDVSHVQGCVCYLFWEAALLSIVK